MLKAKKIAYSFLWSISPTLCYKIIYLKKRGHLPDFQHPSDFSEIVLSQILSNEIIKYSEYTDKLKVRDHIKDWGLESFLPQLYGVWDTAEEIDFDVLPSSFVLKTNHGCGSHYICPDKAKLNIHVARNTISKALLTRIGIYEKQYSLIHPMCFAEEFIDDTRGGGRPLDYKFMSCDGEIRCILVCSERDVGTRLSTYDINWKKLNWIKKYKLSSKGFDRPQNFDQMLNIASTIANKFEQVRIDLYSLPHGRIYIGELTFTPEGGFVSYFTNDAIRMLGHRY